MVRNVSEMVSFDGDEGGHTSKIAYILDSDTKI